MNAKVTDILLEEPKGLHISELSKRAGVDAMQLGRIMRLLATKHVYYEGAPDFAGLVLNLTFSRYSGQGRVCEQSSQPQAPLYRPCVRNRGFGVSTSLSRLPCFAHVV